MYAGSHNEIIGGAAMGGGLMWVLVLILIFFIFFKDGFGGKGNGGEEATRGLIVAEAQREDALRYQTVVTENNRLKAEMYTDKRFDCIERELSKVAKVPPVFCDANTVVTAPVAPYPYRGERCGY
jgi:hypothetical protein